MSFKPGKINFKVYNKPKAVQNKSLKLPISIAAMAITLSENKISSAGKEAKNMSDEESSVIEATKNRDTSSFYSLVFKKGINTLRPEIVMVNEYSPIVTGKRVRENQNSISVKYGNNTFVEVTNTARLLELHQMLKENAINTAERLIKRYSRIPSRVDIVIRSMESTLKNNVNEIYDENLEKMRKKLLEKTIEKTNNVSIQNQIRQLSQETLVLVADYVMNKYIAKMIMIYIAKIFDFKESIEAAFEINRTSITSPVVVTHNSKASQAETSKSSIKKTLSEGVKSYNPTKESNFENILDISNYLKSLVFLSDTVSDIENARHSIDPNKIIGAKKERLKDAIDSFKKINFAGCFGGKQRKRSIKPFEIMEGTNVRNVFDKIGSDTNSEAFAELMAALCYDQVAGATQHQREFNKVDNDLSNGSSFISLEELFEKEIMQQLNMPQYKRYFRNIEKSNEKVGNIVKKLFKKRNSPYDEKTFIPFETNNTIASSLYDNNEYFPAEEILFTSALKSGDKDFQELENIIRELKNDWELFSENIIKALGLDFDNEGKKSFDNLNTVDQLNPISYLNYYLNLLADDLEANYINSGPRRRKSVVSLMMLLNNADSVGWTVSSYKATLLGTLINEGIGAPSFLANQTSGEKWIDSKKGERVINSLYSESEAQTELSFRRILNNLDIADYPKGKRGFPGGGDYTITLTATGLFDGTLGTFPNDKKHHLGVDPSDHIAEGDRDIRRYNYGNSGEADVNLTEELNLKVTTDWLGPVIAISLAVLVIGTGGAFAAFVSAGGALAAAAFVTGITLASISTVTAIGAGIASAVTDEAMSKSSPVGIQITSSGLYTFHTISNSALIVNINDKEGLHMPSISENTASGSNTYFFKNASGNGADDFTENLQPGNFGGLRKFSAVHRSFLFHYLASNLLSRTQRLRTYITKEGDWPGGPDFKIEFKISRMKGLIKALRNENVNSTVKSEIQAYQNAKEIISEVKNKIIKRKEFILGCLSIIDDKISSLENTHKNLKNFLQSTTRDNFKIIRKKLDENKFFEETAGLLTPSYKDYLAKSYFQNYVTSTRTSTFTKYDKDDLRDLKIMYRVLTTKNYGFLEKEKFGRKNVYHIGIPIGLLDYLRRQAFKETGDEDYLDSSLICITLHKKNQLNAEIDYIPKQFVFDMSKHILPCTYLRNGRVRLSNHIVKATDDKPLNKIIDDMESFVFNDIINFGFKSNGKGLKGIVGNRTSDVENNYKDSFKKSTLLNHIFDYYLKMYTKIMTSLDISESTFLTNSENVFAGQIDNQTGVLIKNQIYNRYLRDYPEVANNATQREIFSRSINLISNSVLFSSNNRLKEMLTINCFERVFSILVNDKDFVIGEEENDTSQVYKSFPNHKLTAQLTRPKIKINTELGKNSKKVKSYIKETGEKSTSMSGFSVEIGILKKW